MSTHLLFAAPGPVPYPSPQITLFVGGHRALDLLKASTAPTITVTLDQNQHLSIGPTLVGTYRGPAFASVVPLTADLLPAWALAIARTSTAQVTIDSLLLGDLDPKDLRNFRGLYRMAICPADFRR